MAEVQRNSKGAQVDLVMLYLLREPDEEHDPLLLRKTRQNCLSPVIFLLAVTILLYFILKNTHNMCLSLLNSNRV